MAKTPVTFTLNGAEAATFTDPGQNLLDVLRRGVGDLSPKYGCGQGTCGTCTVLIDGEPHLSCLTLAEAAQGRHIETTNGLGQGPNLHALQNAFMEGFAAQCGYCTPGMLITARDIVARLAKVYDRAHPRKKNRLAASGRTSLQRVILASVEGFPGPVPFVFRLVGPLIKGRFLKRTFNPGIKLPAGLVDHFTAPAQTTPQQAIEMIDQAIAKQQQKGGFIPASPLFGKLSTRQWVDLHCRHAEMHFGMIERTD